MAMRSKRPPFTPTEGTKCNAAKKACKSLGKLRLGLVILTQMGLITAYLADTSLLEYQSDTIPGFQVQLLTSFV